MSLRDFYKGKKIFLTGHTGFKGAWLAFWLREMGAEVTGFALPPDHDGALFDRLGLADAITHLIGDIRDAALLRGAIEKASPDIVFHMAAQALVRRSYRDPLLTFGTNALGSAHLLDAVRHAPSVRSLVYITSDKCYFNKELSRGYSEQDELGGADPYSASKACAELVFKSYYLSYFQHRDHFACAATRAGNVIGGGDRSEDRIVPDIVRAMENGRAVTLRSPEATRPWQHVMDPLYGYMELGKKLYEQPQGLNGEAFNFGPPDSSIRTVMDLTRVLTGLWDKAEINVERRTDRQHEATLLHLSIDKVRERLGWEPCLDFDRAVTVTGQWYRRVHGGEDAADVTRDQINAYMKERGAR